MEEMEIGLKLKVTAKEDGSFDIQLIATDTSEMVINGGEANLGLSFKPTRAEGDEPWEGTLKIFKKRA